MLLEVRTVWLPFHCIRLQRHFADLRVMLRLQPNNAEALAELSSLVTPQVGHASQAADSSSSSPSSSSSSHLLHIHPAPPGKHRKPPLPFALYDVDRRKLKVVSLPLELPVPRMETLNYPSWDRFEVRRVD